MNTSKSNKSILKFFGFDSTFGNWPQKYTDIFRQQKIKSGRDFMFSDTKIRRKT